ncbi:MAG: cellulase family glycosylhydrolase [Anaerolineae bacterium]|nr:cellulase family glycosylhydrolase [Anaerolineae bacterium]
MDKLTLRNGKFVDSHGREVILRGVNLSGSTKTPPDEPSQIVNNFSRHREVSFVGRPFPREQAHEHFERLRHWGFNCLRFLTTWEAIEHTGYGQYDTEYLDYFAEMVKLAGEYGFYVFIDPHQDVWSRMTGGDGAPGWTLEAVGFDISKLDQSEAAITMQRRYPDYGRMVWTNNYHRLACRTMFTLFFAGDKYAPQIKIAGASAQYFLQNAFINSIAQIAMRLKDMPHVLGYGAMNEPSGGFLGLDSLETIGGFPHQNFVLTPAESIFIGSGFTRTLKRVEAQGFMTMPTDDDVVVNPMGVSAWKTPDHDVWRKVGIYNVDKKGNPYITRDFYFKGSSFLHDGLLPFMKNFITKIRSIHSGAILFVEPDPMDVHSLQLDPMEWGGVVNASHWYDVMMLMSKQFNGEIALDIKNATLAEGRDDVARMFKETIADYTRLSQTQMGGVPTLIGEFGLAFDMNDKHAYKTGDFSMHELALSMYYDAMDANLAHTTLWNYTPDNNNRWGDNWNEEDLSIFSRDQQTDPSDINSGGRAIKGFSRPYVVRAGGDLLSMRFDWQSGVFVAEILAGNQSFASEIYIPQMWYPNGIEVIISSGEWSLDGQMLRWNNSKSGHSQITILPKKG